MAGWEETHEARAGKHWSSVTLLEGDCERASGESVHAESWTVTE